MKNNKSHINVDTDYMSSSIEYNTLGESDIDYSTSTEVYNQK